MPIEKEADYNLKIAKRRRMWELEGADRYDYLGDYGNDDSDREMLQENYNSIFEANMDNWRD